MNFLPVHIYKQLLHCFTSAYGLRVMLTLGMSTLAACNNKGKEETIPDKVTFTEHIAPLLYQNCTPCHRPNGGAHFNLVTYEDARNSAHSLVYVTRQRSMPPWPADPGYTQFIGQRVLSQYQIDLLDAWVQQGMQEGDPSQMPRIPDFISGSNIGVPDVRIPVHPQFMASGQGDIFKLVKVPFELPQDTFAAAIEFVAGNSGMVHHVNGDLVIYEEGRKRTVFEGTYSVNMELDSTIVQAFLKLDLPNDDGSFPVLRKSAVNYLPGVFELPYPKEIGGHTLPKKGAFLLNDIHYGFSRKDDWDSSYINIFYAPLPPERPLKEFQLGTNGVSKVEPNLFIEPNTVKKVYSRYTISEDISVITLNPHMHLLGISFKGYAVGPQGDTIKLISIPRWDFNWQYFYRFKYPVKIPKGYTIIAEGVYDNTANNKNNPFNPPQFVSDINGSMKSTDEMFQFIINYVPYKKGDEHIDMETRVK